MSVELTKDELRTLSSEAHQIIENMRIATIKDCGRCNGELTLRIEAAPTGLNGKHQLWAIGYNCANCLAMTRVWQLGD